ncbi:Isochorismatase-like protein [Mariannaea sp. PMI_226]|nr:Isochorismatase-like protein [Mariannaea sp. PMI_226]
MKFSSVLAFGLFSISTIAGKSPGHYEPERAIPLYSTSLYATYKYERLNKSEALLLVVDIQEGLYQIARDFDPTLYRDQVLAHAAIGKVFNLPVIMTTSADQGPNGPLAKEILEMYPDMPLVQRQGEVNAWDNEEFRKTVQSYGRKQIIMAGITTDVCTTFLALSLRDAGYSVWANAEASGTNSVLVREISNDRMARAGVQIVSLFSIVCDLMRDWRNTPGAKELIPWLNVYYPVWGWLARTHAAAVNNGTIQPGENTL